MQSAMGVSRDQAQRIVQLRRAMFERLERIMEERRLILAQLEACSLFILHS